MRFSGLGQGIFGKCCRRVAAWKGSRQHAPCRLICCLVLGIWLLALTAPALADEPPTDTGHISGDIFGKRARWYHGHLSLSEVYDDNIFNTENDTTSDFITVITPGVQFTIPGTDQAAEAIVTDTTTPGGQVFGRFADRSFRRFRAYAGYAPEFQFYGDHPDENVVNHQAQGGLQYNLRGGLTIDVVDRLVKDYDRNWADRSTQTDQYLSNLFDLVATYPLSPKFRLRADYSNNIIDYRDDEINGYRDRRDNSGAGFIFYQFRPKTAAFIQGRYTDINYRNDDARDGDLQEYLAGIRWDMTAKTSGSLRVGYGLRSYDETAFAESRRLIFEGNMNYLFSPKTRITANAFHRNAESSELAYDYTITTGASLTYSQQLRYNLDFELDVDFRHDDYQGGEADRKDDFIQVTPSFSYAFRTWLSASLAYVYRNRDTDAEQESFAGNRVVFKLTGAVP